MKTTYFHDVCREAGTTLSEVRAIWARAELGNTDAKRRIAELRLRWPKLVTVFNRFEGQAAAQRKAALKVPKKRASGGKENMIYTMRTSGPKGGSWPMQGGLPSLGKRR